MDKISEMKQDATSNFKDNIKKISMVALLLIVVLTPMITSDVFVSSTSNSGSMGNYIVLSTDIPTEDDSTITDENKNNPTVSSSNTGFAYVIVLVAALLILIVAGRKKNLD